MGMDFCNITTRSELSKKFESMKTDIDIKPIYHYLCPVIILICFISILFNAMLISISRQSKAVHKSPILLLSLNLALTDLIASLLNALSILLNSYLPTVYGIKMQVCWMLTFEVVRCAALVASALHLLALAFIHYRGIVKPLHYRSTMSRTINIISIACWLLPGAIMMLWFTYSPCQGFRVPGCDFLFLLAFNFRYMVLTLFALPLLLMFVIYIRIFMIISKHQKGRRINHERSTLSRGVVSIASGPIIGNSLCAGPTSVNLPQLITATKRGDLSRCQACTAAAAGASNEPEMARYNQDELQRAPQLRAPHNPNQDDTEFDVEPDITFCDDATQAEVCSTIVEQVAPAPAPNGEPSDKSPSNFRCKQVNCDTTTASERCALLVANSVESKLIQTNIQKSSGIRRIFIRRLDVSKYIKPLFTATPVASQKQQKLAVANSAPEPRLGLRPQHSNAIETSQRSPPRNDERPNESNQTDSRATSASSMMFSGSGASPAATDDTRQLRTSSCKPRLGPQQAHARLRAQFSLGTTPPERRKEMHLLTPPRQTTRRQQGGAGGMIQPQPVCTCQDDKKRRPVSHSKSLISRTKLAPVAGGSKTNGLKLLRSSTLSDSTQTCQPAKDQMGAGGVRAAIAFVPANEDEAKMGPATKTTPGASANSLCCSTSTDLAATSAASNRSIITQFDLSSAAACCYMKSSATSATTTTTTNDDNNNLAVASAETGQAAADLQLPTDQRSDGAPTAAQAAASAPTGSSSETATTTSTTSTVEGPTSKGGSSKDSPLGNNNNQQQRDQQLQQQTTGEPTTATTITTQQITNNNSNITRLTSGNNYYEPQRRHIPASAAPQTNTKALVTTLLILGTYVTSYIPAIVFQALSCVDHCPYPLYEIPASRRILFGSMTTLLIIAKSIIDPMIYSYRMNEIQVAISRYLSKRRSNASSSMRQSTLHTTSQRMYITNNGRSVYHQPSPVNHSSSKILKQLPVKTEHSKGAAVATNSRFNLK